MLNNLWLKAKHMQRQDRPLGVPQREFRSAVQLEGCVPLQLTLKLGYAFMDLSHRVWTNLKSVSCKKVTFCYLFWSRELLEPRSRVRLIECRGPRYGDSTLSFIAPS